MSRKWTALLMCAAILGCGIAIGVIVDRTLLAHGAAAAPGQPPARPAINDARFQRFSERLGLNDEQAASIRDILAETRQRTASARLRIGPEMRQIREHGQKQIRALLSAEQLPKYEQMLEKRSRAGGPRGPRGADGPGRGSGRRGAAGAFEAIDSDGSASVSRAECEASDRVLCEWLLKQFDAVDADGDGEVTKPELMKARRKERAAPPAN